MQSLQGDAFLLGWCESTVVLYKDRSGRAGVDSGIYTKGGHGRIMHISWLILSRQQSTFYLNWVLIERMLDNSTLTVGLTESEHFPPRGTDPEHLRREAVFCVGRPERISVKITHLFRLTRRVTSSPRDQLPKLCRQGEISNLTTSTKFGFTSFHFEKINK